MSAMVLECIINLNRLFKYNYELIKKRTHTIQVERATIQSLRARSDLLFCRLLRIINKNCRLLRIINKN